MSDAYTVEQEDSGCEKCYHGRSYRIVGPDGVGLGRTIEDADEISLMAAELNEAFERGRKSVTHDLPARFQLGAVVRVGKGTGMVSGICFRKGKVFYEVGGIMYASDDVTEPLRTVETNA